MGLELPVAVHMDNVFPVRIEQRKVQGAGFETDTNIVTLIGKDFREELPMMEKEQVAMCIIDKILEIHRRNI